MGRQGEKRQVGAARRRSRGHGLARLDGTRTRATVASKVMESGETAGHGNGRRDVQTARKRSAQARSWKPGRRRQPSGARERWKPEQGRDSCNEARCAARQRDRPCFWAGDALPARFDGHQAHEAHHVPCIANCCGCGLLAELAQSGRWSSRGAKPAMPR